jgi:hypothetical protein
MVLLSSFKGAMRFDRGRYMSVHVSACTSYDFKALTPVMWKCVADKVYAFLRFVAKMSDQFLDQRINAEFCIKLGKNAENCH